MHLGPERRGNRILGAGFAGVQQEIRVLLADFRQRLVARLDVAELDQDVLPVAGYSNVADFFAPQSRANIRRIAVCCLGERAFHVHLQQEMHATAQVEAEIHWQRIDPGQPTRGAGQQVERHDIVFAYRALQHILRL